jgi:cytochrome P450
MTGDATIPDAMEAARASRYPLGAAVTLTELGDDPHPALARLRADEPVSWVPALNGWLVTRYDLAVTVMRDSATFTVDDPRFSTARVVGPSMLSLDGAAHSRHRRPFADPFSRGAVHERMASFMAADAARLVTAVRPAGQAELRRSVAGPLAVAVMARVLGLAGTDPATLLRWYDAIVTAVSQLAGDGAQGPGAGGQRSADAMDAGAAAFQELSERLRGAPGGGLPGVADASADGLTSTEIVSNAAVLLFGGIETTEGMIINAAWHLLTHPGQLDLVRADPGLLPAAIEESLRLEPAAAVVDRYATRGVALSDADVGRGDLVSVSLAGAGRDPAVFAGPDQFRVRRGNARKHLAFAQGPHFCLGAHLARLEAEAALGAMLRLLPGLRLGQRPSAAPHGLVFRKPPALHARWDPAPSGVAQDTW